MAVISGTSPDPAPAIVQELRRQGRQTTILASIAILIAVASLIVALVR